MRLIDAEPYKNDRITANSEDAGIAVEDIPTVDAVPIAPVKIERYDNGQGRCPLCKTDIPFQVVNDKWQFELYCPHCGTRMNLEDDAK